MPFRIYQIVDTRQGKNIPIEKSYILEIPCTGSAKSANFEVRLGNGDVFTTTLTHKVTLSSGLYFADKTRIEGGCNHAWYCAETMRDNDVRNIVPRIFDPFQNFISRNVVMNGARMAGTMKVTINY